ncbi:MAG: PAAR domain-containing protein [Rhodocyclaceae bacterium]|nr:PAAR domain-containing protein [Rhodocyclaceae bacterium]
MGDSTTGGGKVIEGSSQSTVEGQPVARVGDKATCQVKGHPSIVTILEGDPGCLIDGRPTAFHNATLSCGCKVLGSQKLMFVENYAGSSSKSKATSSKAKPATPPSKEDLASEFNDFFILKDSAGAIVANAHYAIEFPDGTFEYGITDASGHTNLHVTGDDAKTLTIYLQGV